MNEIRALSATGILGSGFREDTLKRALTLEPDFIGADSGSTDPGPCYLGSGEVLFSDSAYKRDLRLMLLAGRAAGIPVLVGSACIIEPPNPGYHCDPASVASHEKVTIPRPTISGDINDTDVFGGQQYGPLVDLDVP